MAIVPTNLNSKINIKLSTSTVKAIPIKKEILNANNNINFITDNTVVNSMPVPTKFSFKEFLVKIPETTKTVASKVIETLFDVFNSEESGALRSHSVNTSEQLVERWPDNSLVDFEKPIDNIEMLDDTQSINESIPEVVEEPEYLGENTNDLKLSVGGSYSKEQLIDENGYYALPEGNTSAKAYENYRGVTKYANGAICQGTTYNGVTYDTRTEEDTGLRYTMIDGEKYYCVATGGAYGKVGDLFEVTTDTGQTFKCIKGDEKSNGDYNSKNINVDGKKVSVAHAFGNSNKCVIEMICDGKPYPQSVRNAGSYNALEQFSGNIESMRLIGSTQ